MQHLPLETARALVASVASIPYAPPFVKVAIQCVLVENLGGSVEHLLAAMGDPSLGCRHLSTLVNPMRHAEPAKFIAIGTPGWRRMMLLAAKHKQQGFDGLIKKHLMFDRSLRSDALVDIEGYATPHEILSYAGVR